MGPRRGPRWQNGPLSIPLLGTPRSDAAAPPRHRQLPRPLRHDGQPDLPHINQSGEDLAEAEPLLYGPHSAVSIRLRFTRNQGAQGADTVVTL